MQHWTQEPREYDPGRYGYVRESLILNFIHMLHRAACERRASSNPGALVHWPAASPHHHPCSQSRPCEHINALYSVFSFYVEPPHMVETLEHEDGGAADVMSWARVMDRNASLHLLGSLRAAPVLR
jgi:hypothetical protein